MVGADDDDVLIDQLGQPSDVQRGVAQETLQVTVKQREAAHRNEAPTRCATDGVDAAA